MGKVNAVAAASTFKSTFRNLKLVLLVEICGRVPDGANGEQIFLGDGVIGTSAVQTSNRFRGLNGRSKLEGNSNIKSYLFSHNLGR